MNLNRVFLGGNLTRDVEVKYLSSGTAVADFGMAINRKWRDGNGEQQEEVTFIDVTLFGRTAEIAGDFLRKGSPVFVNGRLKLDQWDDKETGQKRSKIKVIGEDLQLIGGRPEGQQEREQAEYESEDRGPRREQRRGPSRPARREPYAQQNLPTRQPPQRVYDPALDSIEDDDIPF